MRKYQKFTITVFLLLFGAALMNAQYGYGYGNPYAYGRHRSIVPDGPEPEKEVKPRTAEEIVEAEMPKIAEVLELNEFEKAVVASIMKKYVQQSIELQILDLDPDKLREGMEKIRINQKAELKAGLSEEKYNALLDLQENGFKKEKKKKKKKGKKPED